MGATGRALLRDARHDRPAARGARRPRGARGHAQQRHRAVPAGGDLQSLLLCRPGHRGVPARRGGAVRVGAARRPPVAPTEPSHRGADRLDRTHPPDGAAPARPAAARSARSSRRSARRSGRWRPRSSEAGRAGDRGGAPPRLPGDGTARRARDEEPAHTDPAGRGSARALAVAARTREAIEVLTAESRAGWSSWRGSSPSSAGCPRDRRRRWTSASCWRSWRARSVPPTHDRDAHPRSGHAGAPGPLRSAPSRLRQHHPKRGRGLRRRGRAGDRRGGRTAAVHG